jgi:hypothetical protein
MSESNESLTTTELISQATDSSVLAVCPVCGRQPAAGLVPLTLLEPQLQAFVKANALLGASAGSCSQCIALFERGRKQIEAHGAIFEQTSFVLPTPLRLNADERFTGRGVTIAFLDSGFYAHPDLTQPKDRILAYHNIFDPVADRTALQKGEVASWHGMMTSVVAAGNGHLSEGFYRGIAPDAGLVLVKIGRTGRIPDEHIERGLQWILDHREEYNIRIVNISAGGDFEQTYFASSLCKTVERAVGVGEGAHSEPGCSGFGPGRQDENRNLASNQSEQGAHEGDRL